MSRTFSEKELSTEAGKVIRYAAETGEAVVVSPNGRIRVVITIPIVDLPVL